MRPCAMATLALLRWAAAFRNECTTEQSTCMRQIPMQTCVDPDWNVDGNWMCVCASPSYGAGRTAVATCRGRSSALSLDECAVCPMEMKQDSEGIELTGTPFATFAQSRSASEDPPTACRNECLRTSACKGYNYMTVGDASSGYGLCDLYEEGYGTASGTSGYVVFVKTQRGDCAGTGDSNVCAAAGQGCVDPTEGTETAGDWYCRCTASQTYGARALQAVPSCESYPAAQAYKECSACPEVATTTQAGKDIGGTVLRAIPFVKDAEECARYCSRSAGCKAFTHFDSLAEEAEESVLKQCLAQEKCCVLRSAPGASATEADGANSGEKSPAYPCAVSDGDLANTCAAKDQICVDPTEGTETTGDWRCVCKANTDVSVAGGTADCPATPQPPTPTPSTPLPPTPPPDDGPEGSNGTNAGGRDNAVLFGVVIGLAVVLLAGLALVLVRGKKEKRSTAPAEGHRAGGGDISDGTQPAALDTVPGIPLEVYGEYAAAGAQLPTGECIAPPAIPAIPVCGGGAP
eukprot:TRINITY_DN7399_c0_g1_i2.p1 TRINITY_DN7399_c0_g1~~TRINITY_DN7399_c0_g1_i2.p1  ORF type:complete len:519 (+),score=114.28 TRINITY_DN7399_c0_g1_i2:1442-2998(+)